MNQIHHYFLKIVSISCSKTNRLIDKNTYGTTCLWWISGCYKAISINSLLHNVVSPCGVAHCSCWRCCSCVRCRIVLVLTSRVQRTRFSYRVNRIRPRIQPYSSIKFGNPNSKIHFNVKGAVIFRPIWLSTRKSFFGASNKSLFFDLARFLLFIQVQSYDYKFGMKILKNLILDFKLNQKPLRHSV